MTIENMQLKKNELDIISKILSQDFVGRDRLIEQINKSQIFRNNTLFYLSIKFQVNNDSYPLFNYVRVPVEMRIYKKDCPPIQVLLHVVNGFVNEMEIFFADSSEITESVSVDNNDIVDIIIDKTLWV